MRLFSSCGRLVRTLSVWTLLKNNLNWKNATVKSTALLIVALTLLFLTSCGKRIEDQLPPTGSEVVVSYCVLTWSQLTDEQLAKPLSEYKECDILTSETMRDILRNNKRVENVD